MVCVRAPQLAGRVSTTEPAGWTAPRSAVRVCGQAAPSWLSQYEPLLPSFAFDAGKYCSALLEVSVAVSARFSGGATPPSPPMASVSPKSCTVFVP